MKRVTLEYIYFDCIAGYSSALTLEMYDHGIIRNLGGFPPEYNFDADPETCACKLDGNHVIMIGGKTSDQVFIHEVSTNTWHKRKGNS